MIIAVAWRNIWRNKMRSLVIISAITLGIFAGVFSTAFMKGMSDQRIKTAIKSEVSHIQIHRPGYRKQDKLKLYLPEATEKLSKIRELPHVQGVSNRIIINGMISSAGKGSGVKLNAIVPANEKEVTDIHEQIIEGTYFKDTPKRVNPLVLGQKLAEKLNVQLRSRIVINFTNAQGVPTSAGFRVTGIYKTANHNFDGLNVYARYRDLQQASGLAQGGGHEIAIYLDENEAVSSTKSKLQEMFPEAEVSDWKDLSPELTYLNEAMDQYMYVIIIIILLALCFGIINTMLMAVLERVKELGMLMAIGMTQIRVFFMIMMESVFLSLTGRFTGVIVATWP
ncbi:MAG: ABC transporter permease [Bacteroidales bacterium]|nr:ABC transporter permease [Bacteroidales bacterium]